VVGCRARGPCRAPKPEAAQGHRVSSTDRPKDARPGAGRARKPGNCGLGPAPNAGTFNPVYCPGPEVVPVVVSANGTMKATFGSH